jgi:hypothetical protein
MLAPKRLFCTDLCFKQFLPGVFDPVLKVPSLRFYIDLEGCPLRCDRVVESGGILGDLGLEVDTLLLVLLA